MNQNQKLQQAIIEYHRRQARASHPDGHSDNGGRWYPSESEKCPCCNYVRHPSRSYPWSYMVHCRTSKHIEHLYNIPAGSIMAEINRLKKENRTVDKVAREYAANYRRTLDILQYAPEVA